MKTGFKKKQKFENLTRIEMLIREFLESFIRKTDSEKRSHLFGNDPLKN